MGSTSRMPFLGMQGGDKPDSKASSDFPQRNLSSAGFPGFQDSLNASAHSGPEMLPFPFKSTLQPPHSRMDGMPPFNATQANSSRPFQPRMDGRPKMPGMGDMPPIYGALQANRAGADGRPQMFGMLGMPPFNASRANSTSLPFPMGDAKMPFGFNQSGGWGVCLCEGKSGCDQYWHE